MKIMGIFALNEKIHVNSSNFKKNIRIYENYVTMRINENFLNCPRGLIEGGYY